MRKSENFLNYVPKISYANKWEENDGQVTIHIINKGFCNKIVQVLFKKPKVTHIDLDLYGSFVWLSIDGKKTVSEVADILKNRFGNKVEPLYERLVLYMKILYNNHLISFIKE